MNMRKKPVKHIGDMVKGFERIDMKNLPCPMGYITKENYQRFLPLDMLWHVLQAKIWILFLRNVTKRFIL